MTFYQSYLPLRSVRPVNYSGHMWMSTISDKKFHSVNNGWVSCLDGLVIGGIQQHNGKYCALCYILDTFITTMVVIQGFVNVVEIKTYPAIKTNLETKQ